MFDSSKFNLEKIDTEAITQKGGYSEVRFASDGRAGVCRNDKWGFVDKEGNEVIPCKYENVEYFYHGHCFVEKNGKWGIINTDGKEVVPCEYENILGSNFPEHYAIGEKNKKCYIISKFGRLYLQAKAGKVAEDEKEM